MDKTLEIQGFAISPNWGSILSIEYLISNGKFVFSNVGHKGVRPRIVLKEPVNGVDCFEIGYDRYGLIIESECVFSGSLGAQIEDSSKYIASFIRKFLITDGATEHFNTTHP